MTKTQKSKRWLHLLTLVIAFVALAVPDAWSYSTYKINYNSPNGWKQVVLERHSDDNCYHGIFYATQGYEFGINADSDYYRLANGHNDGNYTLPIETWYNNPSTGNTNSFHFPSTGFLEIKVATNNDKAGDVPSSVNLSNATPFHYLKYWTDNDNKHISLTPGTATTVTIPATAKGFGFPVSTSNTTINQDGGWYSHNASSYQGVVKEGTNTYNLSTSGTNFSLSNSEDTEYTFTLYVDSNNLPTSVKIVAPVNKTLSDIFLLVNGTSVGSLKNNNTLTLSSSQIKKDDVLLVKATYTDSADEYYYVNGTLTGNSAAATLVEGTSSTATWKAGDVQGATFKITNNDLSKIAISKVVLKYTYYLAYKAKGASTYTEVAFDSNDRATVSSLSAQSYIKVVGKANGTSTNFLDSREQTVVFSNSTFKYYGLTKTNGSAFVAPRVSGQYIFKLADFENGIPASLGIQTPAQPAVLEHDPLYFCLNLDGGETWTPTAMDFNKLEEYTYSVTVASGHYINFTFATSVTSGNAMDWDNGGVWRPTDNNNDTEISKNGEYTANGSSGKVFKITQAGTYTFKVTDPSSKTFEVTGFPSDYFFTYKKSKEETYTSVKLTQNNSFSNKNYKFYTSTFTVDNNTGHTLIGVKKDDVEYGSTAKQYFHVNNSGAFELVEGGNADMELCDNATYYLAVAVDNDGDPFMMYINYNSAVPTSWNPQPVVHNYYFAGDLNDWFSEEFENPVYDGDNLTNKGINATRFNRDCNDWKFRPVTAAEISLYEDMGVDSHWYAFDKFPGKRLTGQFQIIAQGSWTGEVYSHAKKINNYNQSQYNAYHVQQITPGVSLKNQMDRGNGQNFHMASNAIENATIYFRPGATGACDMFVTGTPRNYYVFYATDHEEDVLDGEVFAKINPGKPNENNYMLPGIGGLVNQAKDGSSLPHMNSATGIEMRRFVRRTGEGDETGYNASELIAWGLDEDIANDLAGTYYADGSLPNGRTTDTFKYLYIAKIPNGFEDPAGWKYSMRLEKALDEEFKQKSVAIVANHIYFLPGVTGVVFHLNDDDLQENNVYEGVDVQYWYRAYNQDIDENGKYVINFVEHGIDDGQAGSVDTFLAFTAKEAQPNSVDDLTRRNLYWKKLDTKVYQNKTTGNWQQADGSETSDDQVWMVADGRVDERVRLAVPKHYANAYIQMAQVLVPKANNAPRREGSEVESPFQVPGATVRVLPQKLTFESNQDHMTFAGQDIFKELTVVNDGVWTGVKGVYIDDEPVSEVDETSNMAPIFYNLQGVRVANPTNGIYIMVKGNKSKKVMF